MVKVTLPKEKMPGYRDTYPSRHIKNKEACTPSGIQASIILIQKGLHHASHAAAAHRWVCMTCIIILLL
jgi:hypothetical protein